MRSLRNRLSAIYQIITDYPRYPEEQQLRDALIAGLADGTIQPQVALRDWRNR